MAAYVERRFHLADAGGAASDKRTHGDGATYDDDFSTIEVHIPARSASLGNPDDNQACAWLEEARNLGRKYREFRPQPVSGNDSSGAVSFKAEAEMGSITIIPWKEFRLD